MMILLIKMSRMIQSSKRPLSYSGDEAVSRLREAIMSGSSVPMLEDVLSSTKVDNDYFSSLNGVILVYIC